MGHRLLAFFCLYYYNLSKKNVVRNIYPGSGKNMKNQRHIVEVLRGTIDQENPLSILQGQKDVLNEIFGNVNSFYENHIDRKSTSTLIGTGKAVRRNFTFPTPKGINVNMMPIKLFDYSTIPDFCKPYQEMIRNCIVAPWDYGTEEPRVGRTMRDRVAYLTIHESHVPAGQSQRRPGLHIERPAAISISGRHVKYVPYDEFANPFLGLPQQHQPSEYQCLAWGMGGCVDGLPVDGIYIASNVANSSSIWPVSVVDPQEVTDVYGGVEHMRDYLGPGRVLGANEMCWMTDCVPHESLPLEEDSYRQFFRLVVGRISVWYSKHNTPNPLGVLPDAPISDVDKFAI
jgi:hypothetical protein